MTLEIGILGIRMDTLCVEDLRVAPLWVNALGKCALRIYSLEILALKGRIIGSRLWGLSVEALGVSTLRGRLSGVYVALLVNRLYSSP